MHAWVYEHARLYQHSECMHEYEHERHTSMHGHEHAWAWACKLGCRLSAGMHEYGHARHEYERTQKYSNVRLSACMHRYDHARPYRLSACLHGYEHASYILCAFMHAWVWNTIHGHTIDRAFMRGHRNACMHAWERVCEATDLDTKCWIMW